MVFHAGSRRQFMGRTMAGAVASGLSAKAFAQNSKAPAIATGPVEPTWNSLVANYRYPDWFRDAKFGIWAHWGHRHSRSRATGTVASSICRGIRSTTIT